MEGVSSNFIAERTAASIGKSIKNDGGAATGNGGAVEQEDNEEP
jgi:hypothetical protein